MPTPDMKTEGSSKTVDNKQYAGSLGIIEGKIWDILEFVS